ncbi:uncharacterized protein LOC142523747 [Primulina tabacum]|uniref:uncharacterized protein LOC142523747 n=1 Tax=Primulina tabacum TaxID=48773 RepID=UPI003F59113C
MDPLASSTAFRPPVMDCSNYALWKVMMRMFIKSIEERAWQRVLDGWSPPRILDDDGDSRSKLENSWSNDEIQTSNFNSKELNAIFTSVDVNIFSLITNCISAKEAWNILQKHCEWSESVRRTKLRMLTSKFESLRMDENETIVEYDRRLREIANEAFGLGDPIKNKGKAVALQTIDDSMNSLIQEANESDLGEESISLINKKFGDYLKRMRDKKKSVSTPKSSFVPFERNKMPASVQGNFRSKNEALGRPEGKKLDSVQCRECSGFSHYANECANRLRRNKNMAVTLSDEDTDEDHDSKEGDDCTSFTAIQIDTKKLQVNPFCVATGVATPGRNTKSISRCFNAKSLDNSDLDNIQESDQEELTVKDNLEKSSKTLAKFNSSSSKLDIMLTMGKDSRSGLGYVESMYEHGAWYFDSECSRHMTGSKEHLIDYLEVKSGRVTYGGGAKGRIVGKGTLNFDGLPVLHNVLHVEGLNSNLISISQLCDDDLHELGLLIIAILWEKVMIAWSAKVRNLDLWHQKLGHVSFKTLKNLCKFEVVREKYKEDNTEGLLDTSEPSTSTGVEPSEVTPGTTPPLNKTEAMENEDVDDDVVIIDSGRDILSKIQKNHPSSKIIGEIHDDVQIRKKEKVDY